MKGKRKLGLLVAVVGLLLVTGLVVTNVFTGPAAVAEADKEKVMTIELDAVITINDLGPGPSASYFLSVGEITKVNGKDASGIYYCRGFFTGGPVGGPLPPLADGTLPIVNGLTFVDQYFLIDGQGTILATGDESPTTEPMVVTGGTGRFHGVEGTKTQVGIPLSPDFDFLSEEEGGGPMTHTFKINIGDDDDDDDDD